jgi:hypothetical protein
MQSGKNFTNVLKGCPVTVFYSGVGGSKFLQIIDNLPNCSITSQRGVIFTCGLNKITLSRPKTMW